MPPFRAVLLSGLLALPFPLLHAVAPTPEISAAPVVASTEPQGPRWRQIDPLLDESIAALNAGDNARAEELRQQALALSGFSGHDSVPPVITLVAHAERALKAGHPDAAIIDYRASLSDIRNSSRLPLAKLLIAKGESDEAIGLLGEIFRSREEYGAAQLLLGKTHLALYAKNQSIDELADATLALDPPTRTAKTILTPEWEIALNALRASLKKLSPEQQTALADARKNHRLLRAGSLLEAHERAEALPFLTELLAQDPGCAEAYELRARISDYEEVRNRTDLQIAAELRAPAPEIPAQGDEFTLALAQANLHVHQHPYEVNPYLERANVRKILGKPTPDMTAACLKDAQFACDLDPDDPVAFAILSEAYSFQKRGIHREADGSGFAEADAAEKKALYDADFALGLAPKEIDLLVWRAAVENKHGAGSREQTNARAMLFLNRAIQESPTNLGALLARVRAARELEDHTLADDDCRTLIRVKPSELFYSYELGWVLLEAEKFRASAKAFAASIGGENVPDDAYSLQVLALAFAGDPKSEELAAAIPEHSVSASGVGTAYWNIGNNKHHRTALVERVTTSLKKAGR